MSAAPMPVPRPPLRACKPARRVALAIAAFALIALPATADAAPKNSKNRDTTPPQTTITDQPSASSTATSASFSFSSTEPGTFECKLDTAAFAPCTSPKAYSSLMVASHEFQVRAKDQAGNLDATPARYAWSVTAPAPLPTSRTVNVPASIPSDCSANVQEQLASFINAQPDGTTIEFPVNGCYAQNDRILIKDKTNLTIDGRGSEFRNSAPNDGTKIAGNWVILRGTNVRARNLKITGNFHLTGARSQQRVNEATVAGVGNQFNMGIGIYGGNGIHVTDTTIEHVFGDGVTVAVAHYIEGSATHPLDNPSNVHVERVQVTKTARHCVSPSQADGFWLQDSTLADCWYGGFDGELDNVTQKLKNLHLLRNTFDGFFMFGIVVPVAGDGSNTENIEIRNNTFNTRADNSCNNLIEVGIYPTNPNTIKNVVVADNTLLARSGIGVRFDHVDSGAITGNRDAGYFEAWCSYPATTPFAALTNSTGVTVANNGPAAG